MTRGPLPDSFVDRFWPDFDCGWCRAILALDRSSPPELAQASGLETYAVPTLILWLTDDPYVGSQWDQRYADALAGNVRLETIERAGHWMWLDRPDVIDTAAEFRSPAA